MRKAFTLIEVNLAMLIMAGGILSIVGLYAFGFRENRQSREDVASAAMAEAVMSPLVAALSNTNLTWTAFNSMPNLPSDEGWFEYFNDNYVVEKDPTTMAKDVFNRALGYAKGSGYVNTTWPSESSYGLKPGLVVLHDEGSPIVRIGFRATRTTDELMSQPLYFTEVRFQGLGN